jgi:hypothetical protein
MFLEHLRILVLKDATHKAGALQGTKAQQPTSTIFKRGFTQIL